MPGKCRGSSTWTRRKTSLGHLLSAKWNDLPMELMERIGEYAIFRARESYNSISQYEVPQDVDLTFGAINRSSRAAFLELIRKRGVFVDLRLYRLSGRPDLNLQNRLDMYFGCSNIRSLQKAMDQYPNKYSCVRIEVEEKGFIVDFGVDGADVEPEKRSKRVLFPTSSVVFLCTSRSMMLLSSVLQHQPGNFWRIKAFCQARDKHSKLWVKGLLSYLGVTVCNGASLAIHTSNDIMTPAETRLITSQVARKVQNLKANDFEDMFACSIRLVYAQRREGVSAHTLIPIAAEGLYWHLRMTKHLGPRFARQSIEQAIFVGLLLKGLSDYLLLSENTHEKQLHYLLRHEDENAKRVVEACQSWASRARFLVGRWSIMDTPNNHELFQAHFSIVLASAQFNLALARAASLSGASISKWVRADPTEQSSRRGTIRIPGLSADNHLKTAQVDISVISQRAHRLMFQEGNPLQMDLPGIYKWLDDVNAIARKIEVTIAKRDQKWKGELLVEPILELSYYPFYMRLPNRG